MSLDRFTVKFFVKAGYSVDEALFIDIFHEWIRFGALDGILLDVADYRHVPYGPGVMLITHDINFAMDHGDGRFGLLAQRKRGRVGTQAKKIVDLLRQTVEFADLLENDWRIDGGLHFEAGAFAFASNDRLLAPNTPEAYAGLLPEVQAVAGTLYPGQNVAVSRVENDPRQPLTMWVDSGVSQPLAELAEKVGVAA